MEWEGERTECAGKLFSLSRLSLLLLNGQARLASDDLGNVRDVPACAHGGALAGVVVHNVQQ